MSDLTFPMKYVDGNRGYTLGEIEQGLEFAAYSLETLAKMLNSGEGSKLVAGKIQGIADDLRGYIPNAGSDRVEIPSTEEIEGPVQ